MNNTKLKSVLALAGLVASISAANAVPLNLLNDTISAAGMTATTPWSSTGAWLSWNITDLGGGNWHYSYTWTSEEKQISHLLLEVTEDSPASDFWNFTVTPANGDPQTYSPSDPGNSNPGLPGDIYALKFNRPDSVTSTTFTFAFDSNHYPVWGDFYAKDGTFKDTPQSPNHNVTAWNSGFLSADANDGFHIARPNGTPIPDPVPDAAGTMALLGIGLVGIEALRRRFSQ
jgi:hypothetical protein